MSTPVVAFILSACDRARDIGVMYLPCCSGLGAIAESLIGLSIDLDWILAMSLTADSTDLKSRGRIPAAASIASRLDVFGSPIHRAKALRCTLFNRPVLLLHCHTVEPYSIMDLTGVL